MVFLIVVCWIVGIFIVASKASDRDRSYGGFFALSLFFSPVISGLILILLEQNKKNRINKEIAELTEKAEKGGAEDQYNLGMKLLCNNKPSEAEKWLQKALDQGYVKAESKLFISQWAILNHFKTKGPYTYYSDYMARQGYDSFQYLCGLWHEKCYELETKKDKTTVLVYDKEPDLVQAAYWYKKAADQGNPHAQDSLGQCYLFGKGVERDVSLGYGLLLKAAEGDSPASKEKARQLIEQTSGMSYEQFVLKYVK